MNYLAKKARSSIRGVQEACSELVRDGKLRIEVGQGPNGTNIYLLPRTVCTPAQFAPPSVTEEKDDLPPHSLHPANSAPRNGAAEKAPEKAALDCTQTIRNGKEREGTVIPESLLRARRLFRMRDGTPLDKSEEKAWKDARACVDATEEDEWQALEYWFSLKGEKYRRKNLSALLNNWNGEIERARTVKHNQSGSNGYRPPHPDEVYSK